jgi:DNA-binding beta-propeller fold protein YncE
MWGEYGLGAGQFRAPVGVCYDLAGYVYVVDATNNNVQKFDGYGNYVLGWGSYGQDKGQFLNPEDVNVGPDERVYVADSRNRRIQVFTTDGEFITLWDTPNPGPLSDRARGVAFDSTGDVYVTFGYPARVEKYTPAGEYLYEWHFPGAHGIAIDASDRVYVVDPTYDTPAVRVFTTSGVLLHEWGSRGGGPGEFDVPIDVALDASGRVYVTDLGNARVQIFSSSGQYLDEWGESGAGQGEFSLPRGIEINPRGFIFVVDGGNYRIQKFGYGTVRADVMSWGRIKALYRPSVLD